MGKHICGHGQGLSVRPASWPVPAPGDGFCRAKDQSLKIETASSNLQKHVSKCNRKQQMRRGGSFTPIMNVKDTVLE